MSAPWQSRPLRIRASTYASANQQRTGEETHKDRNGHTH